MSRSWADLVLTPDGVGAEVSDPEPESGGFLNRLRAGMTKTRQALSAELRATAFGAFDDEAWERLEETLLLADVGVPTTARIVERLEALAGSGEPPDALGAKLRELLVEAAGSSDARIDLTQQPAVILVAGVNGTGKTTTIGKLAWHLREQLGLSVLVAAGDTYRAAAVEQLAVWAERSGAEIVRAEQGSDPGAVVFDALAAAQARAHDVVIVDTAGRLHNERRLMDELRKLVKIVEGKIPGAPHETLLTVDATTGHNGLSQARLFAEAIDVTGIALTKLDGTAKGGIALAIAAETGLAIKLVGVGERVEDLQPFDAADFAAALLD